MASGYDIDHDKARSVLKSAWAEIKSNNMPPAKMRTNIERVLTASDVTYKYILVTGFLAKAVNSKIHARALQKGSSLPGAYDARSLCHGVVVGFEKSKGNLFGLSNEPFVNKPARHPEHDGDNSQLRNKVIAAATHNALEEAQRATPDDVYRGLVHILRIGAEISAKEKTVAATTQANMGTVMEFLKRFLEKADGGARLVAVWGAFNTLLSPDADVKVYSPNTSDYFSKTAGDVEVRYEKAIVSASECKQRPLNLDDVSHGLKKARTMGVQEYLFIISDGFAPEQEEKIKEVIDECSDSIDSRVMSIYKVASLYATMLNPKRRALFPVEVVRLLRDMRKFESANEAAEIWNQITSEDSVSD